MSLHEIDLAQKISDKIMCVNGDKIKDYGTPKEIFKPSLIQNLYEITNGSYNITFGSVELTKPEGEPKLFVVSGAGTGIPYFRQLQRLEIPFYVGVLHDNDIDFQVAKVLAEKTIVEKAFCTITQERYQEAYNTMMRCNYVLYTGVAFGEINSQNELLLNEAKKMNIPVVNSVDNLIDLYNQ
jgi:iron complex transport system ATP-binding protein